MPGLSHHNTIPCTGKYLLHPRIPYGIVHFREGINLFSKDPGQPVILRRKEPLAHDPPGPLSGGIKNEHPPAAVVPADLGPGEVDGAVPFSCGTVEPEERAGLGTFDKDAPVIKERNFVRVHGYFRFLTSIFVINQKTQIAIVFFNGMDKAEVAATLPALAALKRHGTFLSYNGVSCSSSGFSEIAKPRYARR